jgi:hypothetical protein
MMCSQKGSKDKYSVRYLATHLEGLGYKKMIVQSDSETNIVDLLRAVKKLASIDIILRQTPTESHQTMGAGEKLHKQIGAHVRALKLQMERRYSITIGISDFMTPWLIRHAAWLQNRFKKGTAYYCLTGTSCCHLVVECGEMVLARENDVRRVGKFKPSWVKGI